MVASYLTPGMPAPLPPAPGANAYLQPGAPPPQLPVAEAQTSQPIPPSEPPPADDLLAEWRAHHGSDWVKVDDLAPSVRRLIDARERVPAIRQRLPRLVATCRDSFKLEAKVVGNAARPVTLYRVVESELAAGLEGS
jgi:hypothetical protein